MRTALMLAGMLLAGCSTLTDDARDAVRASLPEPASASFEPLRAYPGAVVCGTVTANDLSGMRRSEQRFVYTAGRVIRRPDAEQLALFCTETPALALEETLGIGPWGEANSPLNAIHEDLRSIEGAIDAFRRDRGDVPLGGIEVLASPPEAYLDALPRDPWGRPYEYSVGLGGRSNRDYTLRTLGADGAPGGSGENADIGREHLPYLDRLDRL